MSPELEAMESGERLRVSVVVPTFHRLSLLKRCLRALCAQNLGTHAFEVLVVDDGHEDETQAWVTAEASRHPEGFLRYLRARQGRGPAVARNTGWQAARANLIAFTDDDTLPAADWLEKGEWIMRRQGWSAMAGQVVVPEWSQEAPTDHEKMTRGLEMAEFVTANAFVRREALRRVRGFDERFERAWREDTDLQFRLESQCGPIARCSSVVVYHPVRPERWGVSLRQQRNVFFDALLFRKHPHRYRQRVRRTPPWSYYATVVAAALGVGFAGAGLHTLALVCAALSLALLLRLAWQRLRGTSRRPAHVFEMLATSALIPFLSVYWRVRGALHFRVWFL